MLQSSTAECNRVHPNLHALLRWHAVWINSIFRWHWRCIWRSGLKELCSKSTQVVLSCVNLLCIMDSLHLLYRHGGNVLNRRCFISLLSNKEYEVVTLFWLIQLRTPPISQIYLKRVHYILLHSTPIDILTISFLALMAFLPMYREAINRSTIYFWVFFRFLRARCTNASRRCF